MPVSKLRTTLKRGAPKRKRSGTRRGRIRDTKYMAWLAAQPPMVPGPGRMTIHHVRRFGALKNDRRTIPLPQSRHQLQWDMDGTSIEALGFDGFERYYAVDIEAAIVAYSERYEGEQCSRKQ
jgi:hypothetical protein